jgi:hypothetical protein
VGGVAAEAFDKQLEAALLPMVAALGCGGVESAHWLPDRAGHPVVWLRTHTRAQREHLERQAWVLPQVQVVMTRLAVPHDVVWRLRLEITSAEDEARLLAE